MRIAVVEVSKAMDDRNKTRTLLAAFERACFVIQSFIFRFMGVLNFSHLTDGAVSRIERLIKVAGVDVNVRDEKWFGDTSLHYSALEGKVGLTPHFYT